MHCYLSFFPLQFSCNFSVAVFGCMNSKSPIKIPSSLPNVSDLVYKKTDWVVVNFGFCYWANWWINSMLLTPFTCLMKCLNQKFEPKRRFVCNFCTQSRGVLASAKLARTWAFASRAEGKKIMISEVDFFHFYCCILRWFSAFLPRKPAEAWSFGSCRK